MTSLLGGAGYFAVRGVLGLFGMVPILERVRRRVTALMQERGVTKTALGAAVGISLPNISEMCNPDNPRNFPIDKLDDIAAVLKVPTYQLFLDDPARWTGRRDRRKSERRSGAERRRAAIVTRTDWPRKKTG